MTFHERVWIPKGHVLWTHPFTMYITMYKDVVTLFIQSINESYITLSIQSINESFIHSILIYFLLQHALLWAKEESIGEFSPMWGKNRLEKQRWHLRALVLSMARTVSSLCRPSPSTTVSAATGLEDATCSRSGRRHEERRPLAEGLRHDTNMHRLCHLEWF